MNSFLKKYSEGKIDIKYYVLSPLVENKVRKVMLYSLIVFTQLMIFLILPITSKALGLPIEVITIVGALLLMLALEVYSKKRLFRIKRTGNVIFNSDSLMHFDLDDNLVIELPYSEIQRIEYKKNVPKSAVFGHRQTFKTLIVQFIKSKTEVITIELANEMWLTKEEEQYFRRINPMVENTLTAINPTYGVERVNKLKYL